MLPLGAPRGRSRVLNPGRLTQLLMLFPQCSFLLLLFLPDLGMVSNTHEKRGRLHRKSLRSFPCVSFLGGWGQTMHGDPVPFTLEGTERMMKNRPSPDKGAVGVNTRLLAVLTKGKCNYRKHSLHGSRPRREVSVRGRGELACLLAHLLLLKIILTPTIL